MTGSAVGVKLQLPFLGLVFIVCAHLSATSSRTDFYQTLDDLETILKVVPNDAIVICGTDANCNLAGVDSSRMLVGPYTGDIFQAMQRSSGRHHQTGRLLDSCGSCSSTAWWRTIRIT